MRKEEQPLAPITVRSGLRDASQTAPWLHVPKLVTRRLTDWCVDMFRGDFHPIYKTIPHPDDYFFEITDLGILLATSLDLDLPVNCYVQYGLHPVGNFETRWVKPDPTWTIRDAISANADLTLDIIDFMLQHSLSNDDEISDLSRLLTISNSAWSVSHDSGSLVLRRSNEETSNFARIVNAASESSDPALISAGRHLRDAHSYAWRRSTMNPQAAYQSAVMAIESALREAVMPGQSHARLGNIARQLRLPMHQWRARLGGQAAVEQLAKVLDFLAVDHDKHGQVTYQVNDIAEAQDAVTIATAIVGLAERGFLAREETGQPETSP